MLNLKFSFPLEKEYIRKNQLLHNFGTIGRILSTIVVSPYLFGKISLFPTEKIPIICVYQLFSSTHPDRDHISIFQDKILFHVCHLIHIYQVTLMAPPAFVNVNDGTNEGLAYTGKNIFTVQFHPEASPGPRDSGVLFDRFMKMMEVKKNA